MKRAFWIALLFMIGLIIGAFFLGKEVIFNNIDYHIPEEYRIEIKNSSQRYRYIEVSFYNEDGYEVDKYYVPHKQRQRIVKERIITDKFCNIYTFYTFLYVLCAGGLLIYFIQWCASIECCKRDDRWYSCCTGLCEKRCDLYNAIDKYDLTPHKKRFKLFWGY